MFHFGFTPTLLTSVGEAALDQCLSLFMDFYGQKRSLWSSLLHCCIILAHSISLGKLCTKAPTLLQSVGILSFSLKQTCSSLFDFKNLSDRETHIFCRSGLLLSGNTVLEILLKQQSWPEEPGNLSSIENTLWSCEFISLYQSSM